MALPKRRMAARSPVVPTPVELISEPRESTFTALVPESRVDRLLKYVDGHPWTVNWYGQLVNSHTPLNHIDLNLGNLSQSYVEILGLTLMVDSTISSNFDETSSKVLSEGSAIVPFGVKPNKGDLFRAKVDRGEDAFFVVNRASRDNHRKDSLYIIDYTRFAYANDSPELVETLKKRVNETYHFENDSNYRGSTNLVTQEKKSLGDRLKEFLYLSRTHYFSAYCQRSSHSLLIPGLTERVVDTRITDFIFKTVDVSDYDYNRCFQYTSNSDYSHRDSILDCLLRRVIPNRNRVEKRFGFTSARMLNNRAILNSPWYMGVDYVLEAIDPNTADMTTPRINEHTVDFVLENVSDPNLVVPVTGGVDGDVLRVLPTLFEDHFYIVSNGFYDYLSGGDVESISYLEVMIARYLNKEVLSREDLIKLTHDWEYWSPLEQFYYLPVVWFLCKVCLEVL